MGELDDEVAAITKPAEEAASVGSRLVDHMLQQQQAQAEAEASAAAASGSMILNEGEEYVTEVKLNEDEDILE